MIGIRIIFCLFLLWAVFSDLWGFIYISRL